MKFRQTTARESARRHGRLAGAAAFATVALLIAACSSSSASTSECSATTTFPASALSTVTSDGGKLHVSVHGAPSQPLSAGLDCLELDVTDASTGATVDGLSITMTPWMPAMGHGASSTPVVTALGDGRYVLTEVSLVMPGEWQLRTQFSGPVTDSVEPTFNVD